MMKNVLGLSRKGNIGETVTSMKNLYFCKESRSSPRETTSKKDNKTYLLVCVMMLFGEFGLSTKLRLALRRQEFPELR